MRVKSAGRLASGQMNVYVSSAHTKGNVVGQTTILTMIERSVGEWIT